MSASRLTLALSDGALRLPEGPVAVFGPPAGYDLSALRPEGTTIVTHFFPDAAAWAQAGFAVAQAAEGPFAAALVILPRAKDAARALIAEASAAAPLVIVDGQKHDGIDSMLKAVKARRAPDGTISKAHGKLFWFTGGDFADWAAADRAVDGFITRPGVFSADGPDKGSLALIDALPPLKGRVADLGAGWGFLARHILGSATVTHLDLVEADAVALDCARRNVADPRAAFHWADATRFTPDAPYDAVVSNPPFHVSRAGDPGLGQAFISAAARMLTPHGSFWMVANRHLPYEVALGRSFHHVEEAGGTPGFKVIHASRPHRIRH
ncbi:class I SAM-dependent methyltransferase [Sinisalibacter aestuarii]|uniref:MFS transporter n=1 Tax=Sinisalibacter aestuarii TaxID=2949426 RepID=A0ABQ5LMK1_9RHOB|nr:methyltransferase [Sinisalibacter aestuarii]GKY86183.1 MFS transporter [Sinisalibacter aestuarii]